MCANSYVHTSAMQGGRRQFFFLDLSKAQGEEAKIMVACNVCYLTILFKK